MNVLIIAGSEVSQKSADNVFTTLRGILLPNYTVQTVTQKDLSASPWTASCALLVAPCVEKQFSPALSSKIQDYVASGGSFLALTAGGSYSSRKGSHAPDLIHTFYDNNSGGYVQVHPPRSLDSSRAIELCDWKGEQIGPLYEHGSCEITGFPDDSNLAVVARYSGASSENPVAVLRCMIGRGRIVLSTASIETPVTGDLMSSAVAELSQDAKEAAEQKRIEFLKDVLRHLGLRIPEEHVLSHPLPQFLTSHPQKPNIVPAIMNALSAPVPGSQLNIIKDGSDTFHFHRLPEGATLLTDSRDRVRENADSENGQPKRIIVCPGILPDRVLTPAFDLPRYYGVLSATKAKLKCPQYSDNWGVGEAVLYGEIVTSTQTMLDKNPVLLSRLPTPLVSLASYQLAGRGRGRNVWLSPSGCLQFSILLSVALPDFPANKLVFIQYLFGLAVTEACRDDSVLGNRGGAIRIKWPNDIYVVVGEERRKVGGILINTNFTGGKVNIIIGCGLNVLNAAPMASLVQLLPTGLTKVITMEETLAAILVHFEIMWSKFISGRGSFEPFMDLYLQRWLHSDQPVMVTTQVPPKTVRVVGITPDHGLLHTVAEKPSSSGELEYIDLQPDGNSFDLMQGLIKAKT